MVRKISDLADVNEAFVRTYAHLLAQPMVKAQKTIAEINHDLTVLDIGHLMDLSQYMNRCCHIRKGRLTGGRPQLIDSVCNAIKIIRSGKEALLLAPDCSDFITPEQMTLRLNLASEENVSRVTALAKKIIDKSIISVGDRLMPGSSLVVYAKRHNHIKYYISPALEKYFKNKLSVVEKLPDQKKDWLSCTDICRLLHSGNDINAADLKEVRDYIQKLLDNDTNLSVSGKTEIPAKNYIGYYRVGANLMTVLLCHPKVMDYIYYNLSCPRANLPDGDQFITGVQVCRKCQVTVSRENITAIQEILKSIREKSKDQLINLLGREEKIGNVVRVLSMKRIMPSYFIHINAVDAGLITRDMITQKRAEMKRESLHRSRSAESVFIS